MKPTRKQDNYRKDPQQQESNIVDIVSQDDIPQYNYPFATNNRETFNLNLDLFKTSPCTGKADHNKIQCPYYHGGKDSRRSLTDVKYSSFMCTYVKAGKPCPHRDNCSNCHNSVELNYHPNNYKRRFCIYFPDDLEHCKFGEYCSYSHSESEILGELIHNYNYDADFFMFHYKTAFCPINHIQHDRSLCVYSHNWQDYRRKPNKYYIQPEPCPDWQNSKLLLSYEEGCPRGLQCCFCHGWKEPEFHPFLYKTKKCEFNQEQNCPRLNACPYYHTNEEFRNVTEQDRKFFEFTPRNRALQGIFKLFKETVFGVDQRNDYNEMRDDDRQYEEYMKSMTSFQLKPIFNTNKADSAPEFHSSSKRQFQERRTVQAIDYNPEQDEKMGMPTQSAPMLPSNKQRVYHDTEQEDQSYSSPQQYGQYPPKRTHSNRHQDQQEYAPMPDPAKHQYRQASGPLPAEPPQDQRPKRTKKQ